MQNNKEKNIIEKFQYQNSSFGAIFFIISISLGVLILSLPSLAFVKIGNKYGLVFAIVICFVLMMTGYGTKLLW